jgi:hypothetical protein
LGLFFKFPYPLSEAFNFLLKGSIFTGFNHNILIGHGIYKVGKMIVIALNGSLASIKDGKVKWA